MRPPYRHFIALVVALLGSLAAPASAVAHGWLHEHAAHEAADHHRQAAVSNRDIAQAEVAHGAEVEEQEDHHRHGHDAIVVGPATRDGLRLAVVAVTAIVVSRVELPMAEGIPLRSVTLSHRALLASPDPGGISPPSLRAPPVS